MVSLDPNHFNDRFQTDIDTAQISEASKKKSPKSKRKRIASERELSINAQAIVLQHSPKVQPIYEMATLGFDPTKKSRSQLLERDTKQPSSFKRQIELT